MAKIVSTSPRDLNDLDKLLAGASSFLVLIFIVITLFSPRKHVGICAAATLAYCFGDITTALTCVAMAYTAPIYVLLWPFCVLLPCFTASFIRSFPDAITKLFNQCIELETLEERLEVLPLPCVRLALLLSVTYIAYLWLGLGVVSLVGWVLDFSIVVPIIVSVLAIVDDVITLIDLISDGRALHHLRVTIPNWLQVANSFFWRTGTTSSLHLVNSFVHRYFR